MTGIENKTHKKQRNCVTKTEIKENTEIDQRQLRYFDYIKRIKRGLVKEYVGEKSQEGICNMLHMGGHYQERWTQES